MHLEDIKNWVGVLIPINNKENYYLILTMDFDQYDFDKIITEKIIPLITQEKEKFKQES